MDIRTAIPILDSINNVLSQGVLRLTPRIAELLTVCNFLLLFILIYDADARMQPNSNIYNTALTADIAEWLHDIPVIFLWYEIHHNASRFRLIHGARYGVAFYIDTRAPWSSIHLAWVLLRFIDIYSHYPHRPLRLLALSYCMTGRGVTGIMIFGANLESLFTAIRDESRHNLHLHLAPNFPITTWPHFSRRPLWARPNGAFVRRLVRIAWYVMSHIYLCSRLIVGHYSVLRNL